MDNSETLATLSKQEKGRTNKQTNKKPNRRHIVYRKNVSFVVNLGVTFTLRKEIFLNLKSVMTLYDFWWNSLLIFFSFSVCRICNNISHLII
jgi:hypothetical protein